MSDPTLHVVTVSPVSPVTCFMGSRPVPWPLCDQLASPHAPSAGDVQQEASLGPARELECTAFVGSGEAATLA